MIAHSWFAGHARTLAVSSPSLIWTLGGGRYRLRWCHAASTSGRRTEHGPGHGRLPGAVGIVTEVICPRCSNRAKWGGVTVLTRSPAGRINFDGAATSQAIPAAVNERAIRTRSGRPHRSVPSGQADHRVKRLSPRDRESSVAGTPRRCPHPKHTQRPIAHAHSTQHSYAESSLGPPTSCGSTG